jgi:hypothetical protein
MCSALEFCIIVSLHLSESSIYFKEGPFFPGDTQRYGVVTCLVTMTHWMDIINYELKKNKNLICFFTPVML